MAIAPLTRCTHVRLSLRYKVTSTSIGDHEIMVIGKGNIVDESLVEVVNAVVEVCMATVNGLCCKNI